jgi:putative membrane protein insertion efficiency factor
MIPLEHCNHRTAWSRIGRVAGRLLAAVAVTAVLGYQALIRPFLVGACKYHPTCSDYAILCFKTHPFLHAVRLTAARLLRCHPFAMGGYDPVPSRGLEAGNEISVRDL